MITPFEKVYRKVARNIIVIIFLVSGPLQLTAAGPGKIEGSVTDVDTYKGVPAANVELLKADSSFVKATITNEQGVYKLEDIELGKYLVRVSCLGYKKQIIPEFEITALQTSIKFGATNIFTESKSLKEVSIIGQKLTGRIEDEKTIYTVPGKSAEIAQSGVELLRQLPDVTVGYMSSDVKLAGNGNILFQVNGKRVDVNYLSQLNPKLVDKIEVITNPGVKYDSDVDAVINILLKKDMKYGLSGRVRLEVPTGKTILGRSNASFDLFYKKVRIYAGGNFRINQYNVEILEERKTTLENDTTTLTRNTTGLSMELRGGFSYGVDWFWNDNNTLNFYSSMQPTIPNNNDYVSDIEYKAKLSYNSLANATEGTKNQFYDYSLFYKHKFQKKDHDISFEGYYSKRNNNNSSIQNEWESEMDTLLFSKESYRTTNNNQFILKADYNYPFTEKLKISVGYNGNFNQAEYIIDERVASTYDFTDYEEARQIGYTNLAWNVAGFNLQAGLRYEFSDIDITHGSKSNNQYNCFLPSVSTQYKLGKKHNFRLNYRKSVTRPGVNQLSPAAYSDDPYLQSIGNKDLTPAYNNRFEFTHRYQIVGPMYISYRPYINFIRDGIQYVTLNTVDSVQRKAYRNVSNELEYGVTLSGTLALGKWCSISPSYTYFQREMDALPEIDLKAQKYTSSRFNVSSQFILPKEWVIFVEYNISMPNYSLQGWNKQNYEFVAGFYKAINKKFNVTVFTLNPFSRRYVFNEAQTKNERLTINTNGGVNYSYVLFLRLGYSFNIGKEGKKLDRPREAEESGDKKGLF